MRGIAPLGSIEFDSGAPRHCGAKSEGGERGIARTTRRGARVDAEKCASAKRALIGSQVVWKTKRSL